MCLKRAAGLAVWITLVLTVCSSMQAGPKGSKAATAPLRTGSLLELDGCDLPTVFKMLGQEAHVAIILEPEISGSVSARLEDVDAKQAIKVLAAMNNLNAQEVNGTFYVKTTPATDTAHKAAKPADDAFSGALGDAFAQGMTRVYDASLDYMAKPETVEKIAKHKRNYYLALIKEGFTADEAIKIVTAGSSLDPTFYDGKGK